MQKCEVTYQMPFNESLKCLKEDGGDIAITTLRDASRFFSIPKNQENFQYICPNGTVTDGLNPCNWTSQMNRLVITAK